MNSLYINKKKIIKKIDILIKANQNELLLTCKKLTGESLSSRAF